ncbi:MAG: DUF493 domain-containing protein [Bacteroidetes bacterium]|nr:DUF493 domain-containing protein [Bacteroidota bacterium]
MSKLVTPKNGNSTNSNPPLENVQIEFPVTFQLKAVMDTSSSDDENKKKLIDVFNNLKVKNKFINTKQSSKGTYTSYNYKVTLISKAQLGTLYENLKSVPGLKFAI